jgi:phage N-6-adenine-methyltransferase
MSHKRNDGIETPKDEMRTPPSLFKKLDDRFHFELDAFATAENKLCKFAFTKEQSALEQDWKNAADVIYGNCPYSNPAPFVIKAQYESMKDVVVAMLLPVDFSVRWWDFCMLASEWIRIDSRIRFNGLDNKPCRGSPMFDSAVVIFDQATREKNGHLVVSEMGWKE